VQGEGETKIMKRINDSTAHSQGSHVIVGNDSDIILMSLMCPVSKLYILSQQTKGKSTKFNCISLDAVNMLQSSDMLNVAAAPVSSALLCSALLCSALLCSARLGSARLGWAGLQCAVPCMTNWINWRWKTRGEQLIICQQ